MEYDTIVRQDALTTVSEHQTDPNAPASWWVTDFDTNLPDAQTRMRREVLPEAIESYFNDHLRREEDEILVRKRRPSRG